MTAVPSHNNPPAHSAPKLRTSCDNCGATKVKCDRGQPGCRRCDVLGLICVYGPSRKFGKPPRKRLAAALDSATNISNQRRKVRSAESCENHTTTSFVQQHGVCVSVCPDQETEILPLPSGIDTVGGYEQNEFGSAYFSSLPFDEWTSLEGLETGLDILALPKNNTLEIQGSSSTPQPVDHESHSCPREPYEILRDLICPSPYLHAPEENSDTVCAQLDFVLHFVRSAVDRLARLLKCSCARSGHRVMVHASIISRILIWYQQAAGWTGSNSGGSLLSASAGLASSIDASSPSPPPSAMGGSAGTAKAPRLAQSTGFVVAHVPVSIGTFNIEDQNVQATVRNQLVLSELKKTADLIDLFASQDASESSANGLAGLNSHLGAWLRGEHSRTVRVLRARLQAMNENLDS